MNQLNYQHNDVESCKKPSSSVKTVEFLLRDRSSSAKTVEFCEKSRVLAQANKSSLTRSNRCNSGRVITSVKRSNVGPPSLHFSYLWEIPRALWQEPPDLLISNTDAAGNCRP